MILAPVLVNALLGEEEDLAGDESKPTKMTAIFGFMFHVTVVLKCAQFMTERGEESEARQSSRAKY
jgi:hypothetical protein